MRKVIFPLFVLTVCTVHMAWADDSASAMTNDTTSNNTTQSDTSTLSVPNNQQAGMAGNEATPGVSTAQSSDLKAGGLRDEVVGIKPAIGAINFRDSSGAIGNRALIGFTAEMNGASLAANVLGMNTSSVKNIYFGPQIGFIYSHIGPAASEFFGNNAADSNVGSPGANMFFVPTDLKIGYNLGNFRAALHGGANFFYRSVASSIQLGYNPDLGSGSAVSYIPNFGADLEYGVTNAIAVILRPDLTFGGSNRVWGATLGVSLPIG